MEDDPLGLKAAFETWRSYKPNPEPFRVVLNRWEYEALTNAVASGDASEWLRVEFNAGRYVQGTAC